MLNNKTFSTLFLLAFIIALALFSLKPDLTGMMTLIIKQDRTSTENTTVHEPLQAGELLNLLEKDYLAYADKMKINEIARSMESENPGMAKELDRVIFFISMEEEGLALDEARNLLENRRRCFKQEVQKTILYIRDYRADLMNLGVLEASLEEHASQTYYDGLKTLLDKAVQYYEEGSYWSKLKMEEINRTSDFEC